MLLIERSARGGWVRCRRWESPDYTAAAAERLESRPDLAALLRRETRSGWRFTLPIERILAWLEETD